ncbi:hypothetical protein M8J76_012675 [Diaphorina citri]|nr:hypothetical protein M8J75_000763 [Diaphorina citri]KAI5733500.1 hypothetical protein M8J76_012675 [Diaphorina citri]KAI5738570.1 hypothetical protein M8J77_008600 [Diaphorina citri]
MTHLQSLETTIFCLSENEMKGINLLLTKVKENVENILQRCYKTWSLQEQPPNENMSLQTQFPLKCI